MTWNIVISDAAKKQLSKLDQQVKRRILNFVYQEDLSELPRSLGKPLTGSFKGLWRYRVGDYRIICHLIDHELTVMVVDIEHRSKAYKNH
jgi:mRNA interferase RelE/StbE